MNYRQEKENWVIRARALSKEYPLYAAKQDKIREAFSFSGRSFHTAFAALRGVSFSIGKGECVGLIGLNGVTLATPFAEVTSAIVAGILYLRFRREMQKRESGAV